MVGLMGTSFIWCQQRFVSNPDAVIKAVKISPEMGVYAGRLSKKKQHKSIQLLTFGMILTVTII